MVSRVTPDHKPRAMGLGEDAVTVQPAGWPEIPLLATLQAACFGDSARPEGESAWGESALAGLLAGPGCFGLIAVSQGVPAGFALARQAADECELLSLGVLPAQRRLGIGRRLLTAVCAQAAARGTHRIYLEVAADNCAARALYDALGFTSSAWRKNYYRRPGQAAIDAAVLVRALA